MTTMNVTDNSDMYKAPKTNDHHTSQGKARNKTRLILLLVIAIVSVLGVTGWALQTRSAAQEPSRQEAITLPVYESTVGMLPQEPTHASAEIAAPEIASPNTTAPLVLDSALATLTENTEPAEFAETLADEPVALARGENGTGANGSGEIVTAAETGTTVHFTQRAIVRAGGGELLATPDGASLTALTTGAALQATARTADSNWVYVTLGDGSEGWVAAEHIVLLNGNLLRVITATEVEPALITDPVAGEELLQTLTGSQSAKADGEAMVASVVLNGARLNVRSGPGTNYAIVGKAHDGEQYRLIGRNSDGSWVQIEFTGSADAPGTSAWASTMFMAVEGSVADLPIVAQADNVAQANPASMRATVPATTQSSNSAVGTGLHGNLAFQSGNGGSIHVYNLDTGNLRTLTTGHDPAVSPDGTTVAFTRYDGTAGLYLIGIDGSNERQIFSGREMVSAPSWSADGEWILFSHLIGGFSCRDVGFSICLPDNPFLNDYDLIEKPAWGLARVNQNGEAYRDLPALNTAYAADWRDGGIVYQAATGIEITYDSPDYEGHALFNQQVGYQDPAWQPGGGRIVFQEKGADHTELWSANPDGSGLVALTRPETTLVDQLPSNVAPAWSPDGQQIVYLSNRDTDEEAGPWRLWVMDADGGNQRSLPIDAEISYEFGLEQVVSWGPQV